MFKEMFEFEEYLDIIPTHFVKFYPMVFKC
jgi:hypothetical protein